MRVALFALTGFGNRAIDAVHAQALFTRRECGPYPYYPEVNIEIYAKFKNPGLGQHIYTDYSWYDVEFILRSLKIDTILVCTYDKIFPKKILSMVSTVINIHPSLLPEYKGRNPIKAVLDAGGKKTGVTAHVITDEVDGGKILYQQSIPIEVNDTEGTLRKKLSTVAYEVIKEVL